MLVSPRKNGPPNSFEIKHVLECRLCAQTCPAGMTLDDWLDMSVGLTPYGLQIWCKRHKANVAHFDFCGNKVVVNATAARDIVWPVTQ